MSPEEALALGLSPGTPVYRFQRVRFADNSPMSVEIRNRGRLVSAFAVRSGYLVVRGAGKGRQPPGACVATFARPCCSTRTMPNCSMPNRAMPACWLSAWASA